MLLLLLGADKSLGFSVVGLRSEQQGELGIFVQEVQRGGLAFVDGRLKEGDQVRRFSYVVVFPSFHTYVMRCQSVKTCREL